MLGTDFIGKMHDGPRSGMFSDTQRHPSTPSKYSDDGYFTATPTEEGTDDESIRELSTASPRISSDNILVAVVGVGFVGLELALAFASAYRIIGFDVSEQRVEYLQKLHGRENHIHFTHDAAELSTATHFLISVPTLLSQDQSIDCSALRSALKIIRLYAQPGTTVVVESSVAVGMTRQLLGSLAAEKGLFGGMSPERVDPGRNDPPIQSIPKVISGLDDVRPGSLVAITRLYSKVFEHVVPVSSPEVAEMVKLYENCQRMVCIAYANEMADACGLHNIDPYEVCAAAATKPFGYFPFSPGVGVGGHCIPVNPYYLLANNHFPLLQAATETMRNRPAVLAARALSTLGVTVNDSLFPTPAESVGGLVVAGNGSLASGSDGKIADQEKQQQAQERPRVLVVGVGFKRGQSHLSNSPGLALARSLKMSRKVDVTFADTLVPQAAVPDIQRLADSDWCATTLEHRFDLIIVALKQVGMNFDELSCLRHARVEMWCR